MKQYFFYISSITLFLFGPLFAMDLIPNDPFIDLLKNKLPAETPIFSFVAHQDGVYSIEAICALPVDSESIIELYSSEFNKYGYRFKVYVPDDKQDVYIFKGSLEGGDKTIVMIPYEEEGYTHVKMISAQVAPSYRSEYPSFLRDFSEFKQMPADLVMSKEYYYGMFRQAFMLYSSSENPKYILNVINNYLHGYGWRQDLSAEAIAIKKTSAQEYFLKNNWRLSLFVSRNGSGSTVTVTMVEIPNFKAQM